MSRYESSSSSEDVSGDQEESVRGRRRRRSVRTTYSSSRSRRKGGDSSDSASDSSPGSSPASSSFSDGFASESESSSQPSNTSDSEYTGSGDGSSSSDFSSSAVQYSDVTSDSDPYLYPDKQHAPAEEPTSSSDQVYYSSSAQTYSGSAYSGAVARAKAPAAFKAKWKSSEVPPAPISDRSKLPQGSCAKCTESHSEAPNQLVYCDGICGLAYHQACAGIVEIPEGAWYCTPGCALAAQGIIQRGDDYFLFNGRSLDAAERNILRNLKNVEKGQFEGSPEQALLEMERQYSMRAMRRAQAAARTRKPRAPHRLAFLVKPEFPLVAFDRDARDTQADTNGEVGRSEGAAEANGKSSPRRRKRRGRTQQSTELPANLRTLTAEQLWTQVWDPYFLDLSPSGRRGAYSAGKLRLLEPSGVSREELEVPALGRHYREVWEMEDRERGISKGGLTEAQMSRIERKKRRDARLQEKLQANGKSDAQPTTETADGSVVKMEVEETKPRETVSSASFVLSIPGPPITDTAAPSQAPSQRTIGPLFQRLRQFHGNPHGERSSRFRGAPAETSAMLQVPPEPKGHDWVPPFTVFCDPVGSVAAESASQQAEGSPFAPGTLFFRTLERGYADEIGVVANGKKTKGSEVKGDDAGAGSADGSITADTTSPFEMKDGDGLVCLPSSSYVWPALLYDWQTALFAAELEDASVSYPVEKTTVVDVADQTHCQDLRVFRYEDPRVDGLLRRMTSLQGASPTPDPQAATQSSETISRLEVSSQTLGDNAPENAPVDAGETLEQAAGADAEQRAPSSLLDAMERICFVKLLYLAHTLRRKRCAAIDAYTVELLELRAQKDPLLRMQMQRERAEREGDCDTDRLQEGGDPAGEVAGDAGKVAEVDGSFGTSAAMDTQDSTGQSKLVAPSSDLEGGDMTHVTASNELGEDHENTASVGEGTELGAGPPPTESTESAQNERTQAILPTFSRHGDRAMPPPPPPSPPRNSPTDPGAGGLVNEAPMAEPTPMQGVMAIPPQEPSPADALTRASAPPMSPISPPSALPPSALPSVSGLSTSAMSMLQQLLAKKKAQNECFEVRTAARSNVNVLPPVRPMHTQLRLPVDWIQTVLDHAEGDRRDVGGKIDDQDVYFARAKTLLAESEGFFGGNPGEEAELQPVGVHATPSDRHGPSQSDLGDSNGASVNPSKNAAETDGADCALAQMSDQDQDHGSAPADGKVESNATTSVVHESLGGEKVTVRHIGGARPAIMPAESSSTLVAPDDEATHTVRVLDGPYDELCSELWMLRRMLCSQVSMNNAKKARLKKRMVSREARLVAFRRRVMRTEAKHWFQLYTWYREQTLRLHAHHVFQLQLGKQAVWERYFGFSRPFNWHQRNSEKARLIREELRRKRLAHQEKRRVDEANRRAERTRQRAERRAERESKRVGSSDRHVIAMLMRSMVTQVHKTHASEMKATKKRETAVRRTMNALLKKVESKAKREAKREAAARKKAQAEATSRCPTCQRIWALQEVVCCSRCSRWFHYGCQQLDPHEVGDTDFFCSRCERNGVRTFLRSKGLREFTRPLTAETLAGLRRSYFGERAEDPEFVAGLPAYMRETAVTPEGRTLQNLMHLSKKLVPILIEERNELIGATKLSSADRADLQCTDLRALLNRWGARIQRYLRKNGGCLSMYPDTMPRLSGLKVVLRVNPPWAGGAAVPESATAERKDNRATPARVVPMGDSTEEDDMQPRIVRRRRPAQAEAKQPKTLFEMVEWKEHAVDPMHTGLLEHTYHGTRPCGFKVVLRAQKPVRQPFCLPSAWNPEDDQVVTGSQYSVLGISPLRVFGRAVRRVPVEEAWRLVVRLGRSMFAPPPAVVRLPYKRAVQEQKLYDRQIVLKERVLASTVAPPSTVVQARAAGQAVDYSQFPGAKPGRMLNWVQHLLYTLGWQDLATEPEVVDRVHGFFSRHWDAVIDDVTGNEVPPFTPIVPVLLNAFEVLVLIYRGATLTTYRQLLTKQLKRVQDARESKLPVEIPPAGDVHTMVHGRKRWVRRAVVRKRGRPPAASSTSQQTSGAQHPAKMTKVLRAGGVREGRKVSAGGRRHSAVSSATKASTKKAKTSPATKQKKAKAVFKKVKSPARSPGNKASATSLSVRSPARVMGPSERMRVQAAQSRIYGMLDKLVRLRNSQGGKARLSRRARQVKNLPLDLSSVNHLVRYELELPPAPSSGTGRRSRRRRASRGNDYFAVVDGEDPEGTPKSLRVFLSIEAKRP